jgi:AraC-like DNA-binding protein
VLSSSTILARDGITISDVACRHEAGRGQSVEQAGRHALVFVRRGCFVRSADGVESLLDPTMAYFMSPGEEERYDHPHQHGDDCTALMMSAELAASLWGGDPSMPSGALPTSPEIDLEHRRVLSQARRDFDPHAVFERAVALAARTLEQVDAPRVSAGRPSTLRARQALVDGAREALAADPERSLPELAGAVGVSPHHLSRIFRSLTGWTIARHRMRLRARAALERLAGGEPNLGRLAADLGFADQSHLCRVIRAETGRTPAALRRALASPLINNLTGI